MNSFLLIVSCAIAGVFAQGIGFNSCQKVPTGTDQKAIPAGKKWYQVYRENKTDSAYCYTLSTSGNGPIKINQTLINMDFPFSTLYLAKINKDSSWNVTTEDGTLSSTNQFRFTDTIIVVFSCSKAQLMTLQPGVYAQSKTLSADEDKAVQALLASSAVTVKDYVKAETAKC